MWLYFSLHLAAPPSLCSEFGRIFWFGGEEEEEVNAVAMSYNSVHERNGL